MANNKTPIWFWVVVILCLLWNIMGALSFFYHVFITPEAIALLPENEQALYGEYPLWTSVIFAIAVFSGLLGALALILKKKWAKPIFVISLCAIIPQMIHNLFFTSAIAVYGVGQAVTMPIIVFVLGLCFLWFSSVANKKGWLS